MSAERPILFSTPLVQAILDGRKTETRRPVRQHHGGKHPISKVVRFSPTKWTITGRGQTYEPCPYGAPGGLLWVRESTTVDSHEREGLLVRYESDNARRLVPLPARIKQPRIGHKLANGAYKEAARIWLRVTEVRVERLKDITEEGAIAEGVTPSDAEGASNAWGGPHRWAFMRTWSRIYGDDVITAGANPWVWVVRFEVVSTTGRPA